MGNEHTLTKREIVLNIIIIALIFTALFLALFYHYSRFNTPQNAPDELISSVIISGNSYRAVIVPNLPSIYVRGTIISDNKLADCVEQIESGGNQLAYNPKDTDGREKFGSYQFGQLEWDTFCKGDIWNGEDQRECFDELVEAGDSWRWPSFKKCQMVGITSN